jgi:hypothetical protein
MLWCVALVVVGGSLVAPQFDDANCESNALLFGPLGRPPSGPIHAMAHRQNFPAGGATNDKIVQCEQATFKNL